MDIRGFEVVSAFEEQDINLPVKFYNSVYISSDAANRIPNGSDESLWTLNIINPILKLGR